MQHDETNDPTDNGQADLDRDLVDQGVAFGGFPKPRPYNAYMHYLSDQRLREKAFLPRITFDQWKESKTRDYDGQ